MVVSLVLVWVAMIGGLGCLLAASQNASESSITQRLQLRSQQVAQFASQYLDDLVASDRREALSWLAGDVVAPARFQRVVTGLGLSTAELLDAHGRLLALSPAKPGIVGQIVTPMSGDLASALAGRPSVSNVMPAESGGLPVVTLDVPFYDSADRLRVFGGAYWVSHTPLGRYLSHVIVTPGSKVYLLDASGIVIGARRPDTERAQTLAGVAPRLVKAERHRANGSFASPQGPQHFVRVSVSGTPWQIMVIAPDAQLYRSIDGPTGSFAWLAVGGFGLVGLFAIGLVARLSRSRQRLVVLNAELERIAHLDALTEVRNRRALQESLDATLSAARRHEQDLSVLLIDIDHFKQLNDAVGHRNGDIVLRQVAQTLQQTLRIEDLIGRWGGEEFLVIMPGTDDHGARWVAERLCLLISELSANFGHGDTRPLTVTIGVAQWAGESAEDLVDRADAALYAGKAAGRNTVSVAGPSDAEWPADLAAPSERDLAALSERDLAALSERDLAALPERDLAALSKR
jgi:diguanylate cyclase (GGDEF)-like protein